MKLGLGNGNNKYKFKFEYIETGRKAIKNVYADTEEEAKELFGKEYKDYSINLLEIIKL